MRKYIAIIIASLALFTGQAHAQRCLPKMQGIEVRADMADGFNLGGKDGVHIFFSSNPHPPPLFFPLFITYFLNHIIPPPPTSPPNLFS